MPRRLEMFASRESLVRAIKRYLESTKAVPSGIALGNEILELLKQPEYKWCNISQLERKVTYEKWRLRDEADSIKKKMSFEENRKKYNALLLEYRGLRREARRLDRIRKVLLDNRYFSEV